MFNIKQKRINVNQIMAYESSQLNTKQTIKLFQNLEDSGMAYRLQGQYGRTATALIGKGLIKPNMKYHTKSDINRFRKQQIEEYFSV
jgi:hypothetical protein